MARISDHVLYGVWENMLTRCTNPNNHGYKNYGGRGIKVCDRWKKFTNFYADMNETYVEGLQLDRIDNNNKGYSSTNCRWVTRSQNSKNRRNKQTNQSELDYVIYDKSKDYWIFKKIFKTQEQAEQFALKIKESIYEVL